MVLIGSVFSKVDIGLSNDFLIISVLLDNNEFVFLGLDFTIDNHEIRCDLELIIDLCLRLRAVYESARETTHFVVV